MNFAWFTRGAPSEDEDMARAQKARAGSRAAALEAIRKRFVERVRFDAKNELAAKSRPW